MEKIRFLLAVVVIAVLSAGVEFILPWWSVAIVAFLVSLIIPQRPGKAFLMGFSGVGLCWLVVAMTRDICNDHILSTKMAALFKLPTYDMFLVVTVIVGGLVGGLAGWAGALVKAKKTN